MSLLSALHAGASGLRVASVGVNVTAHNVTNATTEGFSRRTVRTTVADPIRQNGLLLGQGARASGTNRVADRFVNESLIDVTGEESGATASYQALSSIEMYFDETSDSGVSSAYEAFFDDLNSLAMDPSDSGMRMAVVTSGITLADSTSRTAQQLSSKQDDIRSEMEASLDDVQERLDKIAYLNAKIGEAGSDQGAGDYADQQLQMVSEVAQIVGATADVAEDGQVTLFLGGHALVSGPTARELTLDEDTDGNPKFLLSADGATLNVTDELGGGLGGLISADEEIGGYVDDLDDFVETFVDAFNTQHAAGYDANGDPGGDLFSYGSAGAAAGFSVDESFLEDVSLLALAGDPSATAGDGDNLTELRGLQDEEIFGGASSTGSEFLSDLYGRVGTSVAKAELDSETYAASSADLSDLRDSISGVDLDQEAASLMAWQAAYEASSRVIQTANTLLGELMGMVN